MEDGVKEIRHDMRYATIKEEIIRKTELNMFNFV